MRSSEQGMAVTVASRGPRDSRSRRGSRNSRNAVAVDLRPTPRESQFLRELFEWHQRSAKTRWVLGKPLR